MSDYCQDCGRIATRVVERETVCDYCAGHRDGYIKGILEGRARWFKPTLDKPFMAALREEYLKAYKRGSLTNADSVDRSTQGRTLPREDMGEAGWTARDLDD